MNFEGFSPKLAQELFSVPYYAKELAHKGILTQDLEDPRALQLFSMIDRSVVKNAAEEFLIEPENAGAIWSTGTSGTPMKVYRGERDEERFWKILDDYFSLPGYVRALFFCTLNGSQEYDHEVITGGKTIQVSRRHELPADEFDLILGSPAGLKVLLEQGQKPALNFYSTALSLPGSLRQKAEKVLGLSILQAYSTTETGPVAIQCSLDPSTYHVLPDVFVEAAGEEFLVTKLFRSHFPLVRYLTGDSAEVRDSCSCGYTGNCLRNLQGRKG